MSQTCEIIINENEKLKISDLEKSSINIFEYLKLHHNIENLSIDLKKGEEIENLFSNVKMEGIHYVNCLEFKQNCDNSIIFNFFTEKKENYESTKMDLDSINICLQIFSQSLFNKYIFFYLSPIYTLYKSNIYI